MSNARALLFYSVVGVFLATAVLTLLGISGVVPIEDRLLQVLFGALVVWRASDADSATIKTAGVCRAPAPTQREGLADAA